MPLWHLEKAPFLWGELVGARARGLTRRSRSAVQCPLCRKTCTRLCGGPGGGWGGEKGLQLHPGYSRQSGGPPSMSSTPSSTERGRHTALPRKSSCIKDKIWRNSSFRNVSVDHINVLVIWKSNTFSVSSFLSYFARVFEYKGFGKTRLTLWDSYHIILHFDMAKYCKSSLNVIDRFFDFKLNRI